MVRPIRGGNMKTMQSFYRYLTGLMVVACCLLAVGFASEMGRSVPSGIAGFNRMSARTQIDPHFTIVSGTLHSLLNFSDSGRNTVLALQANFANQGAGVSLTAPKNLRLSNGYSTTFSFVENPISDGGKWINGAAVGLDWCNVRTSGSLAFGTEADSHGYDDSTALLTGAWNANQETEAVISLSGLKSESEEVELRLRSALTAHKCSGYEILFGWNTGGYYAQIVRWNGNIGDFTVLSPQYFTSSYSFKTGDHVRARMVNSTITVYLNEVLFMSCNDSRFASGNPGIGFFSRMPASHNAEFGFTYFRASSL
jgi:hypothetical protein